MEKPVYIKDWSELKEVKSETHVLDIDVDDGCGWISPIGNKDNLDGCHYLSTHTFYGNMHKGSTELLQSCGFNVVLANWDEIGY